VFGPIDATIRDCRVGSPRTTAQFRTTDVTHRALVFDRVVVFAADGARTGATLVGVFARTLAGGRGAVRVTERAGIRASVWPGVDSEAFSFALLDAVSEARPSGRSTTRSGARAGGAARTAGTGAGVDSTGVLSESGETESGCATAPGDCCIETGSVGTTGVDPACVESVAFAASVVTAAESDGVALLAESTGAPIMLSRCDSATFLPNDSVLGWFVGSVSATNVGPACLGAGGAVSRASHAPIASDAKVRIPTPFQM
jgi:hypothetical protein